MDPAHSIDRNIIVCGDFNQDEWQSQWLVHSDWLRTVLRARLGNSSLVDDVLQEVAVTAWKKRTQLSDPEKMGPWLYRIAIRKVQRSWRSAKQERLGRTVSPGSTPDPQQVDPFQWVSHQESNKIVREALLSLAPQDREVLLLKHTEGWTYAELGKHLGISIDKIIYRLKRARHRFRSKLALLSQDWSPEL